MEEYTQEALAKKDLEKEMQEKNMSIDDLGENEKQTLKRKYPNEYYSYKLRGIVIHIGSTEAGHYFSYIYDRERNDAKDELRWFEFNDSAIRDFNPREIPNECFGGEEQKQTQSFI
jgi:ubiquitin C-terminal hydrolase